MDPHRENLSDHRRNPPVRSQRAGAKSSFLRKDPQLTQGGGEIRFKKVHGSTQERFSYEWMRYPGSLPEDREVFLYETQIGAQEWEGKNVLDAGCGMAPGRYSRVAHGFGATVVAMDLGTALIRLWDLAKASERMHYRSGRLNGSPV